MKTQFAIVGMFVAATFLSACESQVQQGAQPAGQVAAQTQAQNTQVWGGDWTGTWSGNCTATMNVSDVTDTSAVVVHNYGACGDLAAGTSADNAASITGPTMNSTYLGFDIEYTVAEGGTLNAVMSRGGALVATGQFARP